MGLHSLINQEQYHAATKAGQYVGIGIQFRASSCLDVQKELYTIWIKNCHGKNRSGSILFATALVLTHA